MTLTKTNDRIDVKWSESETFPKSCLLYEVKCCNGDLDIGQIIAVSFFFAFFFCDSFVIFVVEDEQLHVLHVTGSGARAGSAV